MACIFDPDLHIVWVGFRRGLLWRQGLKRSCVSSSLDAVCPKCGGLISPRKCGASTLSVSSVRCAERSLRRGDDHPLKAGKAGFAPREFGCHFVFGSCTILAPPHRVDTLAFLRFLLGSITNTREPSGSGSPRNETISVGAWEPSSPVCG